MKPLEILNHFEEESAKSVRMAVVTALYFALQKKDKFPDHDPLNDNRMIDILQEADQNLSTDIVTACRNIIYPSADQKKIIFSRIGFPNSDPSKEQNLDDVRIFLHKELKITNNS